VEQIQNGAVIQSQWQVLECTFLTANANMSSSRELRELGPTWSHELSGKRLKQIHTVLHSFYDDLLTAKSISDGQAPEQSNSKGANVSGG
jgi:hypothetical protein